MRSATILFAFIFFCLCSCSNSRNQEAPKQETPKALQEVGSIYKSRGSDDLVETLYAELVDKSPELKNFEDKIADFNDRRSDSLNTFEKFDAKNTNYYSAAKSHYERITDSVLKGKIRSLVTGSEANYTAKTASIVALITQIKNKEITLNDLHTLLKVAKTIQLMEKYQKDNLPSAKPMESLIKDLENMMSKADSLSGIK